MTTYHPGEVTELDNTAQLRQRAVAQLRKKRDLQAHLLAYVLVNLVINGIWLLTGPSSFYWPMFPLLGWGIGIAFHIWDYFSPETPSEERIQHEMERIKGQ